MLKDDFNDWMKSLPNLNSETPDIYILYLNGLFVMLKEKKCLPFDAWDVLNSIGTNKRKMLDLVISMIRLAIPVAENLTGFEKKAMRNFKSAFNKLREYIQTIPY